MNRPNGEFEAVVELWQRYDVGIVPYGGLINHTATKRHRFHMETVFFYTFRFPMH